MKLSPFFSILFFSVFVLILISSCSNNDSNVNITSNILPTKTIEIKSIDIDTDTPGDFITSDADGLTIHATLSASLKAGEGIQYSNNNGNSWNSLPVTAINGTAITVTDGALSNTAANSIDFIVQFIVVDPTGNAGTAATQKITVKPAQQLGSLLSISGRELKDSCGQSIVLRGANITSIWMADKGIGELAELAKTGANCARIVLDMNHNAAYTEPIIQACLANKMIPIIEIHDFTGDQNNIPSVILPQAAAYWIAADRLALIQKYQNYLIVNLANEPESWNGTTEDAYYKANKTAIATLRNAGIQCPIMIDGMHFGQDHLFFVHQGATLLNDDPLHKLLYSVHAYWIGETTTQIDTRFNEMNQANLPFVIGELAKNADGTPTATVNYEYIIQKAQNYNMGWLAWWWGNLDAGQNNGLSMTPTGLYNDLTGAGLIMAKTSPYSIKNTSIPIKRLATGACTGK
ncbi:cellulase family glycosylhydrolase [Flavobacterium sp.]|uniref:glycoside hydrolase family 5 protein n=1 Tax=Flavobacterium sp. TaxID=239 RepID=UPI00262971FC|nr:cellulase family glycosylhydrolase [Flavobacterium sp.]